MEATPPDAMASETTREGVKLSVLALAILWAAASMRRRASFSPLRAMEKPAENPPEMLAIQNHPLSLQEVSAGPGDF